MTKHFITKNASITSEIGKTSQVLIMSAENERGRFANNIKDSKVDL